MGYPPKLIHQLPASGAKETEQADDGPVPDEIGDGGEGVGEDGGRALEVGSMSGLFVLF